MAMSMFLRNSVCATKVLRPQIMRLSSQLAAQKLITPISVACLRLNSTQTTPITNAVRSFTTSKPLAAEIQRPPLESPHDHSKLWIIEKGVIVVLASVLPLSLAFPNKVLDSILAILIVVHSFWGLEAIAMDYVRASVVGPVLPKIAIALVYLISIATLGGLFYLITHDIGLANTVREFWSIKANKEH